MIRLFTTSFYEPREERRSEYEEALRRNIECEAIDQLCVLDESGTLKPGGKVAVRSIDRRPLYDDYFEWINEVATPADISIIANADIVIDSHFGLLNTWKMPQKVVFALARWDTAPDGSIRLRDRNDSQDSWVFRGPVSNVRGDFSIGVPRCDNRIARELALGGYTVLNPSASLRTYHLHRGDRQEYSSELQPGFVSPPYLYVWPHNLWSLPRTIIHNARHPDLAVGWRVDRRKWRSRLKLHWIDKAAMMVSRIKRADGD